MQQREQLDPECTFAPKINQKLPQQSALRPTVVKEGVAYEAFHQEAYEDFKKESTKKQKLSKGQKKFTPTINAKIIKAREEKPELVTDQEIRREVTSLL